MNAFRFSLLFLASVACSNGKQGQPDAACAEDAGQAPAPNPSNCVAPDAGGNEKGVGAYCLGEPCQAGSVGCPNVAGGSTLVCSYPLVVDSQGGYQSFCTMPCQQSSDCGSNAVCLTAGNTTCPGGGATCACAPTICFPDAGK